ncbi:MAG: hypothetical protein Q8O67_33415 [Deltaproteobacteria bacterium]|nr:hypothetical protein [Deltaproteobacteria bacterium]
MNVFLLALVITNGSADVKAGVKADPCRGQLDAGVVDGKRCSSPAYESSAVVADVKPEPEALVRDPKMFPGELAFVSGVLALAGGGLIASAYLQSPERLSADEAITREGVLIGGVSVLSVSALVAGAALSTYVFDPSTATLRLPIFEGEPR